MTPNAVSFACGQCGKPIGVTHLVFDQNQLFLVGHCPCDGGQVNFKLDNMIANLMGKVLGQTPLRMQ